MDFTNFDYDTFKATIEYSIARPLGDLLLNCRFNADGSVSDDVLQFLSVGSVDEIKRS